MWGGNLSFPPTLTKIELASTKLIQSIWKFQGCFRPIIRTFSDGFGDWYPTMTPPPFDFLSHTLQNWDNFGLKSGKVDLDWLISVQLHGCGAVNLQQRWQGHKRRCFTVFSRTVTMYYHAIWKYELKLILNNANSFFNTDCLRFEKSWPARTLRGGFNSNTLVISR